MSEPTKDCRTCGWWRNRNSTRRGVRIPGGVGKCTRPDGHCSPTQVKLPIGTRVALAAAIVMLTAYLFGCTPY